MDRETFLYFDDIDDLTAESHAIKIVKAKTNAVTWSDDDVKQLIAFKGDAGTTKSFAEAKSNAHAINLLWNKLSAEVNKFHGTEFTGANVKNKQNELIKTFKTNHAKAQQSGAGKVCWKFYQAMLPVMLADPAISPLALVSTTTVAEVSTVQDDDDPATTDSPPLKRSEKESTSASKHFLALMERYLFATYVLEVWI